METASRTIIQLLPVYGSHQRPCLFFYIIQAKIESLASYDTVHVCIDNHIVTVIKGLSAYYHYRTNAPFAIFSLKISIILNIPPCFACSTIYAVRALARAQTLLMPHSGLTADPYTPSGAGH